ncbi:MAG: ExeA family protein [Gemmataceae bacterium]
MYEAHFGLRHRPFRSTPDNDCYYPATTHETALARLRAALADDEGMALLSGAPGTGKTLLCHRLLEQLGPEYGSAFVTNSHCGSRSALLQAVLFDLNLPYEGRGEQELRLTLTDYLVQRFAAGQRTVLLVDEAQNLDSDLLEELRLLGNLEARHGKAIQVILAAQETMLETLRRRELAGFSQRLAARACLEPLPSEEAADYLVHQLRCAGARPQDVITDEALTILAQGSGGLPRLLNRAAHQALVLACQASAAVVDAEAALDALAQLGLELPDDSAATVPETLTPPTGETPRPSLKARRRPA